MVPCSNSTKHSSFPVRESYQSLVIIGFQQPSQIKFHRGFVFLSEFLRQKNGAFSTPSNEPFLQERRLAEKKLTAHQLFLLDLCVPIPSRT